MKKIFTKIFTKKSPIDPIIIVSGLPRCGTSMMMQMIDAGGIKVVTDQIREADEDNPKGYYEFEKVKNIKQDSSWLKKCHGKAFKMVSALLFYLPVDNIYKIIFMKRKLSEMIASQNKMLERQGSRIDNLDDDEIEQKYNNHLSNVETWLKKKVNIDLIFINFNETILDPRTNAERVNKFLGGNLDVNKMAAVVEKTLHRQKG